MPSKLTSSERLKLIKRVIENGEKASSVCREAGISRVIFYRWLDRYKKVNPGHRLAALKPRHKGDSPLPTGQIQELPPQRRHQMIESVKNGQSVVSVCRNFGVSRTVFYRWFKRYEEASEGQKLEALWDRKPKIDKYWNQTPDKYEKAVLDVVVQHPELSSHKIVGLLPQVGGRPILTNHGVQNVLRRHNLNTFEGRLIYSRALRHPVLIDQFVHTFQNIFTSIYTLPTKTRVFAARLTFSFFLGIFLGVAILGAQSLWQASQVITIYSRVGLIFTLISLGAGTIFLIYSLKYYFVLILVLGFSRQVSGPARLASESVAGEGSRRGSILERLFGVSLSSNRHKNVDGNGDGNGYAGWGIVGGLQPDLSGVELERHPFISIHLPMYNEETVVERLLTACTSFEYENYEVIVIDDSTDGTTQILRNNWQGHPRVKIIHRESREGYKGGALKVALENTDPRAEFVIVFDADFLPYPDTITQFLKYFQVSAGTLDFREKNYESRIMNQGEENSNAHNSSFIIHDSSPIAAVQGYQWHVLNKSENWITRGVRSEYAGSYVIERSGEEILGALKQIAGSVYIIRKDLLDKYDWGTSITEDFELTLRLYRDGYKVVYTPYIQTPSECVSTLKRLIRQRMRWAEGHSHNVRRMFWQVFKSPNVTFMEKAEFIYLSPYYLQAALFMVGTISWFLVEAVFRVHLPFWTSLWGWSLVLTNLCALPLVNTVGLFLEESEERDYMGILSFLSLSYLLAPFQGYAAVKGFVEAHEGPWFRTPKTGRITDFFTPGRFARFISGIFGRPVGAVSPIVAASNAAGTFDSAADINTDQRRNSVNPYLALVSANQHFANFKIRRRGRWVSKAVLILLLTFSVTIYSFSHGVPEVMATNWTNLYIHEDNSIAGCSSADSMTTSTGSSATSITVSDTNQGPFYWYSPPLPTGNENGNTGVGPWTFRFTGSYTSGGGGSNITVAHAVSLVDSSNCANPTTEDVANFQFKATTVPPQSVSISLVNNANVAISSSTPKRVRLRLQYVSHNKNGTSVTLSYNGTTADTDNANLQPSTITVPEKAIYFVLLTPFIPMVMLWFKRRQGLGNF